MRIASVIGSVSLRSSVTGSRGLEGDAEIALNRVLAQFQY